MSSPKSPLKDAKKSAYSVVSKSDLISVNLPQFPKNTTQVARKKWLQDYEKVHNELLQHHIGLSSEQVQQLQEHYVQIQPHTTEIISLRQLPDDWEERQQEEDIKLEIANENHRKVLPRRKMVSFRNRNGIHSDVFNSCQSNDRRSSFTINRSYSPGPLEGNAAGRSCSTDIYHPGNITVGGLSQASDATAPRFMTSNKGFRSKSTDRSLTKSPLRNGFFHIATSIGSQSDNKHQLPERFKVNGAFTIHQQQSNSSNNISSASSPFPFTKTSTIDECVGIISNLVSPPPQYCSQVGRIKMDNIDLSWIIHQGGSDRPSGNLSLDTIRDDLLTTSSSDQRVTAINSPRSVIVMLRNGVSVKHLQIVPLEKIKSDDYKIGHNLVSSSLALGPGSGTHNHFLTLTDSERTSKSAIRRNQSQQDVNNDRALNNGIKSISGNLLDQVTSDSLRGQLDMQAYHHIEDRRRNLLSALREEYHTLCRNVPLNDLINRVACYHKLSNLKETFSTTEGKVEFKSTKKRNILLKTIRMI